ncbi:MAG: hypothetical protein ACYC09_07640 [Bacteroidota bacterium]
MLCFAATVSFAGDTADAGIGATVDGKEGAVIFCDGTGSEIFALGGVSDFGDDDTGGFVRTFSDGVPDVCDCATGDCDGVPADFTVASGGFGGATGGSGGTIGVLGIATGACGAATGGFGDPTGCCGGVIGVLGVASGGFGDTTGACGGTIGGFDGATGFCGGVLGGFGDTTEACDGTLGGFGGSTGGCDTFFIGAAIVLTGDSFPAAVGFGVGTCFSVFCSDIPCGTGVLTEFTPLILGGVAAESLDGTAVSRLLGSLTAISGGDSFSFFACSDFFCSSK